MKENHLKVASQQLRRTLTQMKIHLAKQQKGGRAIQLANTNNMNRPNFITFRKDFVTFRKDGRNNIGRLPKKYNNLNNYNIITNIKDKLIIAYDNFSIKIDLVYDWIQTINRNRKGITKIDFINKEDEKNSKSLLSCMYLNNYQILYCYYDNGINFKLSQILEPQHNNKNNHAYTEIEILFLSITCHYQ